jgi:hypothetical protein
VREKSPKLIVTFHTSSDAMAMEKLCKTAGAPGRLIPVPRQISAGCGLAWCADPEHSGEILRIIGANAIRTDRIQQIEI